MVKPVRIELTSLVFQTSAKTTSAKVSYFKVAQPGLEPGTLTIDYFTIDFLPSEISEPYNFGYLDWI